MIKCLLFFLFISIFDLLSTSFSIPPFFLLSLSVYWQRWAVSIFSVNFTWPVLQDKISQNCATFCHIKCNFFYFTSIIFIYSYSWIMCESQITNMIMPISYSLVSNYISTSIHNLRTFYLLIFFSFIYFGLPLSVSLF